MVVESVLKAGGRKEGRKEETLSTVVFLPSSPPHPLPPPPDKVPLVCAKGSLLGRRGGGEIFLLVASTVVSAFRVSFSFPHAPIHPPHMHLANRRRQVGRICLANTCNYGKLLVVTLNVRKSLRDFRLLFFSQSGCHTQECNTEVFNLSVLTQKVGLESFTRMSQ